MNAPPDREHGLELLRSMIRVRRLEERCAELYGEERIRGFLHLYIGEEAVVAGAVRALEPGDAVVATYREHGHALLRGVSAGAILAEMFGRAGGCSGGRGGSMHLFCTRAGLYGGSAIVGGGLPLAVGLALAAKLQRQPRIVATFFGEGAVAEGAFHEALNLAALWKLPVLFFCENNLYAMGTALARSQAQTDLVAKAAAHAVPAERVDGMDVLAVEEAARRAAARVRGGGGPVFVEFLTYRFRAHSMFDPELYRDKAEVDRWKRLDPIPSFAGRLQAAGLASDADVRRLEEEAAREVEEAVAFAEASPLEPTETLGRHLLGEPLTP